MNYRLNYCFKCSTDRNSVSFFEWLWNCTGLINEFVHFYFFLQNHTCWSLLYTVWNNRVFNEDLPNNLFSNLPAESSCFTILRAGLDSLGLYNVQYMYWYYYMYIQFKSFVWNNNKVMSQFDFQSILWRGSLHLAVLKFKFYEKAK